MENKAYFDELSRVLKKHHIESGSVENGRLVSRIPGAVKVATVWLIPKDAEKPTDGRLKTSLPKNEN